MDANPDLLNTVALTDTSAEAIGSAATDVDAALDNGGDTDAATLSIASVVALAENDWELAAERLEDGIEVNELAAELYLWRSAVAVAQDDEEAALEWLQEAVTRFGDVEAERSRFLAAQYLSLLEYVEDRQPDQSALAERFTRLGVAMIAENAAGRPLLSDAAPDATIAGATATFDDGATFVEIDMDGVASDNNVALVGYERPAPGAAWVQPSEIFYTGPPGGGDGATILTPRNCVATEYRFDLYVEGEFRESVTVPGGAPTC